MNLVQWFIGSIAQWFLAPQNDGTIEPCDHGTMEPRSRARDACRSFPACPGCRRARMETMPRARSRNDDPSRRIRNRPAFLNCARTPERLTSRIRRVDDAKAPRAEWRWLLTEAVETAIRLDGRPQRGAASAADRAKRSAPQIVKLWSHSARPGRPHEPHRQDRVARAGQGRPDGVRRCAIVLAIVMLRGAVGDSHRGAHPPASRACPAPAISGRHLITLRDPAKTVRIRSHGMIGMLRRLMARWTSGECAANRPAVSSPARARARARPPARSA